VSFETVVGSRLQFTIPEELGIDRNAFSRIDSLALAGIQNGAYPGCQVVVAQHGKVIYRKNFGAHTYDNSVPVSDRSVYDLASITKIAASTLTLMDLAGKGLFHLDSTLASYLPEIVSGTAYERLVMRDILTHQAGLTPWIPFYTKTLLSGQWRKEIYSTESKQGYTSQVAENLYILDSYQDSIFARILATPLKKGQGYKYSDVGYYFMKEIIRKQTGMTLDEYTRKQFYEPMGLNSMRYLPLTKFPKQFIPPTEDDKLFRKQLIQGYVHDQGAAMTGGVGGHAGLFSNAIDLASLMQMMLNQGEYGGRRYLNESVVKEFTKCQNCATNRRAIGFDKPVRNLSGGPTCELVSLDSYGHTGFTGTMAWVDPNNGVNYVFLSNRVYPDAENKKLLSLSIRTEIQRVIYEALKNKKDYSVINN
jgi:CubicO group peptidase (beta-lactamase class C family)